LPLSADGVWNTWATTSATNTTVWVNWTATTSVTASTTEVWQHWIDYTGASGPLVQSGHHLRQPTPEELEQRQREAEERRIATEEARAKARQILLDNLTETQRREFDTDGHFHVETRDGQRRYRLSPGSLPLRVHGEDGRRWSYCIHPRESYPADDVALALKLLLEANEDEFLETANATELRA
jgi:hypothetical protein